MNTTRRMAIVGLPLLAAGCGQLPAMELKAEKFVSTISASAADLTNDWAIAKGLAEQALKALSVAGVPGVSPAAAVIEAIIANVDPIVGAITGAVTDAVTATTIASQTLALTRASAPHIEAKPSAS